MAADDDLPFSDDYEADIIPFDAWSDLSARLTGLDGVSKSNILDTEKIDIRDFDASEIHWGKAMADDLSRGDMSRATAYGAKCAEEMKRRKASADGAAAAPSGVSVSLAEWVKLEQELTVRPADVGPILASYGVADLNALAELQQAWSAKLADDPKLAAEHRALHEGSRAG